MTGWIVGHEMHIAGGPGTILMTSWRRSGRVVEHGINVADTYDGGFFNFFMQPGTVVGYGLHVANTRSAVLSAMFIGFQITS